MTDTTPGLLDRYQFQLRRLHSLSGIVPIGFFLLFHLLTNSTAFLGAERYDTHVQQIHDLPWLPVIEFLFIFLPLAFHGILGIAIAWQGKLNVRQYPYMDNWRYTLQRITAWITLVFVAIHLLHFRFAYWFGVPEYASAHPYFFAFTQKGFLHLWLPAWLWICMYVIGVSAAAFHFCNGIVTFCITWGITVGVESRKKLSLVAGVLCIVLMLWGFVSLYALTTMTRPAHGAAEAARGSEQRISTPYMARHETPSAARE